MKGEASNSNARREKRGNLQSAALDTKKKVGKGQRLQQKYKEEREEEEKEKAQLPNV